MYRCQLCDAIVPPGTPAARVVLETRPARYLTIRTSGRSRSLRLDNATTEIEVWINHEKTVVRRTARLDELRDGLGTVDGFLQVVDGSEISREATACPACAASRAAPTHPKAIPVAPAPRVKRTRRPPRPAFPSLVSLRPDDREPAPTPVPGVLALAPP